MNLNTDKGKVNIYSKSVMKFLPSLLLNQKVQVFLTNESLHIHGKDIHTICRSSVKFDETLINKWFTLFKEDDTAEVDDQDENTDEIFTGLLVDIFEMIVEYFIKVATSNAINVISERNRVGS